MTHRGAELSGRLDCQFFPPGRDRRKHSTAVATPYSYLCYFSFFYGVTT